MRYILAALLLLAAGTALADARAASAADCVTSMAGAELNPLGAPIACVGGFILASKFEALPEPDRTESLHALAAVKWGAAAANVPVLLGASSFAWPLGAFVALVVWTHGAEEREFARLCRVHEQLAGHAMHCTYTPPPP